MRPAHRLESLPVYFRHPDARVKALAKQGVDVIKLDIGSPDGLRSGRYRCARAGRERAHKSWLRGRWHWHVKRCARRLPITTPGAMATPDVASEVLPLIGSKEGIAQLRRWPWLDSVTWC